jgi:GNAT superfamily N-acetyltransferase
MQANNSSYSFRLAIPADASVIAHHRARMFRDMDAISDAEASQLFQSSIPWIEQLLIDRTYIGWFAVHEDEIVAGGGIHIRQLPPMPGCCAGGRGGHIGNVYTAPAHRRLGLARNLMELILAWAKTEKFNRITLSASDEGRPLYTSFGFSSASEMQLLLDVKRSESNASS